MEDIVGLLFVWLVLEVVFWGVMYTTGSVLIRIISLGKCLPDRVARSESGRVSKKQSGFCLIRHSGQIYLGAWAVCILGLAFWAVVVLCFVFI